VRSQSQGVKKGLLLKIKEVFPTIQGEGPLAGVPAVFIRLAGCNLKCWFCDTDFSGGKLTAVTALITEINDLRWKVGVGDRPLVVLTGGEPLMQTVGPLVGTLLGHGWRVQIETDGTLWTDLPESEWLDVVCSPKTPKVHPYLRNRVTAWKYLIRHTEDYDRLDGIPIANTQDLAKHPEPLAKPNRGAPVYLQPVDEENVDTNYLNTQEAVARSMEFGHRLCLQQHKILGLP